MKNQAAAVKSPGPKAKYLDDNSVDKELKRPPVIGEHACAGNIVFAKKIAAVFPGKQIAVMQDDVLVIAGKKGIIEAIRINDDGENKEQYAQKDNLSSFRKASHIIAPALKRLNVTL